MTESYVFHSRIFFYIAKNVPFSLFNELTGRRVDLICALFHEKDILKVCTWIPDKQMNETKGGGNNREKSANANKIL